MGLNFSIIYKILSTISSNPHTRTRSASCVFFFPPSWNWHLFNGILPHDSLLASLRCLVNEITELMGKITFLSLKTRSGYIMQQLYNMRWTALYFQRQWVFAVSLIFLTAALPLSAWITVTSLAPPLYFSAMPPSVPQTLGYGHTNITPVVCFSIHGWKHTYIPVLRHESSTPAIILGR